MKVKATRPKLNKGLDPNQFVISVPKDCDCVLEEYRGHHRPGCNGSGDSPCPCAWAAYLADLGTNCVPCDLEACPPQPRVEDGGYKLEGKSAIEHARRVLQRIYRYVLRFENVTAVDLGFAIKESEEKFLSNLAIRIHVGTKLPASILKKRGIPDPVAHQWAKGAARLVSAKQSVRDNPWALSGLLENLHLVRLSSSTEAAPKSNGAPNGALRANSDAAPSASDAGPTPPAPDTPEPTPESTRSCGYCCKCKRGKTEPRDCKRKDRGEPECERCRLAICGVPLDIIEANYFPAGVHPGGDFPDGVFVGKMEDTRELSDQENLLIGRGRVTPLVGGISVGSDNGLAGTLGAIVWDQTDGSPCILGNWHVLAGRGAKAGQPCYQPSIFDGGGDDDIVGHLKRWHFGELGDAAIAQLDGSRYFASGEILGLWHPISGYRPPELGLTVRKWGRTTGFSEGFIDGIHLATALKYDNETVRHFERQFHIAPLYRGGRVSQVGDSGSIVVSTVALDDLELVIEALLRKAPPELIDKLKALIGPGGRRDDLIAEIKQLLTDHLESAGHDTTVTVPTLFEKALAEFRGGGQTNTLATFRDLLCCVLEEQGIDVEKFLAKKTAKEHREVRRVYFAVGMIFAGDTPGSPFGEFALASDIGLLAEDMRFSLRPAFEPRSSFRKLRSRPPRPGRGRTGPRGRSFEPGDPEADPRGGGPQPDGASYQSGGGNTGGG